ncbi:MAG: carbohydrate ABC transporter permease [Lachnospiraceae bacterium]|jgi:putative aldouronate transport system permease protein|nr:carbohydrate ABC transporter permease [Lachnospiraceae bacterium]
MANQIKKISHKKKANPLRFGDWVVAFICLLVVILCVSPLIHLLARSLSSATALTKGQVTFWPVDFDLTAYKSILTDDRYIRSLIWTAFLTLFCTLLSLLMTILCAYPLTYDQLKGRSVINVIIIVTMYFGAGTIPTYLLISDLKMIDTASALIVPSCLSVFNMILMRSFFFGIPASLRESAEIDGAGPLTVLVRIYLPLSTPVLATLALFYAVGRWNGFSDALLYIKNRDLYPIQYLLYNLLNSMNSIEVQQQDGFATPGTSETIKAATVMFATVPILVVYPFLQRYFIAGVTLGAVKE